nr:MAG TPA: hypothetical protein [Bacteriophage sp.]
MVYAKLLRGDHNGLFSFCVREKNTLVYERIS